MLAGNYCQHCGQKAATHRITVKHFIFHDLLHGVWHFEKGILFTLKETFTRPGKMAVDYISGKRALYYNFFYLLLLVLGTNVLITLSFEKWYSIEAIHAIKNNDEKTLDISDFISHNFRLLLFLLIPFFAINSIFMFRRLKFNIAEQSVVAGVVLLTGAAWYILFNLHYYLTYYSSWGIFDITTSIFLFIVLLSPILVYHQVTKKRYSLAGYLWRIITWYLLLIIEALMIFIILSWITGKTGIQIS